MHTREFSAPRTTTPPRQAEERRVRPSTVGVRRDRRCRRGRALGGWGAALVVALLLAMQAPAASRAAEPSGPAAGGVNTWSATGTMATARFSHTATRLPDGQVLVAGGCTDYISLCQGATNAAELYNPGSGTWSATGSMAVTNFGGMATLLHGGQVLVTGGNGCIAYRCHTIAGVELYNPSTGTWTHKKSMTTARAFHTATLLLNDQVLVAGGQDQNGNFLSSAELYNPSSGTWTLTGSMTTARSQHTATLLPNGQVLVAGGSPCYGCPILTSAELYDPGTGTWTATGSMTIARYAHTATVLRDGRVLVAGGQSCIPCYLSVTSAELYDPSTGTWTPTGSMSTARAYHTATLLPTGMVLVAGGCSTTPTNVYCLANAGAEVYNPQMGVWSPTASLANARSSHTATLLANGQVLVAGGQDCFVGVGTQCPTLGSAELYTPGPGPFVQMSANSLAFGDQAVAASSSPQTITITNTGTLPLTVKRVSLGGANPQDYTQTTTCTAAPVAPGHTCTIAVRFAPVAVGSRAAGLSIADNASTSPQKVALSGYATGPNGWVATGSMTTARKDHTATLLPNGKVLVAGGDTYCTIDGCSVFSSAELYDPSTGTWAATGSMTTARSGHTATLLPDGKVLVAGGCGCTSAELYDPTTGTWTATGSMTTARASHTATLLSNGQVLVAGGHGPGAGSLASAELYDPSTGSWTATGSMTTARFGQTATLLANGQVLVVGACGGAPCTSAELYDPATGTWSATGSLATPRTEHTATLLLNGTVLVAGGAIHAASPSAEVYNPRTGTWTATGTMLTPTPSATATRLANGNVLVAGGTTYDQFGNQNGLAAAEVYTPGPGPLVSLAPSSLDFVNQLVGTTSLPQTITVTNSGTLPLAISSIVVSGTNATTFAETNTCTARPVPAAGTCAIVVRFTPPALGADSAVVTLVDNAPTSPQSVALSGLGVGPGGWSTMGSLSTTRFNYTATLLPNGQVLAAGGCEWFECNLVAASAELYDPATGTWSATGAMTTARFSHSATMLPNGKVLVAGGMSCPYASCSSLTSAELYDPHTGTWTATGAMMNGRQQHTATLLPNGQVLVAGGQTDWCCNIITSTELYDPSTGTWSPTGAMTSARYGHTATLLPSGQVLVAGGCCYNYDSLSSAELYDPSRGTWNATGSMDMRRWGHTATLLPSGQVLVAGGQGGGSTIASTELYDPGTGTWTATGSMSTARWDHTATLLPSGQVLAAGGAICCDTGGNILPQASTELYDTGTGTWSATGSLVTARYEHTATLLPNGTVLVAAGIGNGDTPLASAEVYTP